MPSGVNERAKLILPRQHAFASPTGRTWNYWARLWAAGRAHKRALHAGGDQRCQDAQGQHLLHRAENALMEEIPEEYAGQENQTGRAHLRPEEPFGADIRITGNRNGGAGPEDAGHDVKADDDDVDILHDRIPLCRPPPLYVAQAPR